ncbi:MAG: cytochrome ubiquinol oxidase subunit I [Nitrospirales bacterium]|nr:cytochrome ubiquinol oxidase subunit I [Nitrospirales bacterium]
MTLEPLETSMTVGRVAIAASALSHSLFATFIVGSSLIGAITATCSYVTGKEWFSRLAKLIAFTLVLSTATISFLGVLLVFFLNMYWPQFWHRIFHVMFWPFIGEAALFLGEAIFAYAWYYLWEWGQHGWRQKMHLAFIWIAAGCALAAMFLIDITASYMLTPYPVHAAWENIFNPTMIHLDLHRWFGNLAWAGFALAAICAMRYLKADNGKDQRFFQQGTAFCFVIGYGALLIMPAVGYQYLLHLRYGQPQAFYTVMLGERSWLFDLVGLLYGLMILLGSLYVNRMMQAQQQYSSIYSGFFPFSFGIILLAVVVLGMPYHVQHVPGLNRFLDQEINPLGKMQPYKYFALSALVVFGFVNWLYAFRAFWKRRAHPLPAGWTKAHRAMASTAITLAGLTIIMLLAMGWVRESARAVNGYLIYDVMRLKDEDSTYTDTGRTSELAFPPLETRGKAVTP